MKKILFPHRSHGSEWFRAFRKWPGVFVVSLFCIVGTIVVIMASAAPAALSLETENGILTASAAAITDASASGGKAVRFGVGTTASSNNIYRPYRITDPLQLPHAPKDAHYVMWNFPAGTMLQEAFQSLGPNDILVLPERVQPYEIDSSKGFVVDSTRYYAMAAGKRGLVGMGPGVVVQPSASSFSLPRSTSTEGNNNVMIEDQTDGAYFGNFEMRGRAFGQAAYDAIWQSGNNSVWERIYFNGAHRGWKGAPPGEAGAVSGYKGNNQQVYNVEVDCRDPATGIPVGTSPFMFNVQSNVRVDDFYGHNAVAGMPTFWKVTNIVTNRLRSEYNGTGLGDQGGAGINHELVSGTVTHNNPTLLLSDTNKVDGTHISIGTDSTNAVYYINNPTFNASWDGPGILGVDIWPYPGGISQSNADIHVTGAQFRIHH